MALVGAIVVVAAVSVAFFRPDRVLFVGAGVAAHGICSGTFVSRSDPTFTARAMLPNLLGGASRFIRYRVDRAHPSVTASFLGLTPRRADYTPGYGCRLHYNGNMSAPRAVISPVRPTGDAVVATIPASDPLLVAAIDRVFREDPNGPLKAVSAVVVMIDGRIVAERYAAGIGPSTPLLGWSIAKSLTNAIAGVLVRQGRLRVNQRVPASEWPPTDARSRISVEDLLRMRSGIDAAENGSPLDPVSHMEFAEPDMAAFAAGRPLKVPVGSDWEYTSANTLIINRYFGHLIGGGPAGMRAFVEREIFAPLHIRSAAMEFDGAGTFVGSSFFYASARDFAHLGQLYLADGRSPDGARILPPGWVAWSMRSTLGAPYGAGFWTNAGDSRQARHRVAGGFPRDGYFASGVFGQRIYILPSQRIVIARLGNSAGPDFGLDDDLALIVAAVRAKSQG